MFHQFDSFTGQRNRSVVAGFTFKAKITVILSKYDTSITCIHFHAQYFYNLLCLFVCFVALRPKSTAMVIAGRSVHLITLFPGQT